jgi:hypothetical protein
MSSNVARTALHLPLAVQRRLHSPSETSKKSLAPRESDEELLARCQSNDDHALATRREPVIRIFRHRHATGPLSLGYLCQGRHCFSEVGHDVGTN